MKAMVLREHGGLANVRLETDFPDPQAGPGDVVLRVRATSLNYHDIFTRRGMPGIKVPMPAIMGLDVAGELVAVGPGVDDWAAGDRVLVDPINRVEGGLMGETVHGGLAEMCRARAHQLIRIPEGVSFGEAAALPVAWGTALRMMYTNGHVSAGEKVLVLGASGGVGVCCIMLAKMAGAEVVACTSSAAKGERLKALGADRVINTSEQDFVAATFERYGKPARRGADVHKGVDVVVNYTGGDTWVKSMRCLKALGADRVINTSEQDFVAATFERYGKPSRRGADVHKGVDVVVNYTGGDTWVRSMRCLKVGGRLLTCGATAGFDPKEDIRFIWTFELKVLGSNGWARDDIHKLLELVRSGKLKVPIDRSYRLEEAVDAMRVMEDRELFGKIVVTP